MRAVDIHAAGLLAGRQRPSVQDLQRLGIQFQERVAILHVEKQVAGFVESSVLGSAAQIFARGGNFPGLRIDGGDALGAAVGREDALRLLIKKNGVWIGSHDHPVQHGQSLEIENDYRAGVAATDEAATEISGDSDAVNALAGNFPDDREGIQVETTTSRSCET